MEFLYNAKDLFHVFEISEFQSVISTQKEWNELSACQKVKAKA